MRRSVPLVSVNLELSSSPAPVAKEYVAFWPSRYEFCATILPAALVSLRGALVSRVMYQGPRFWLKLGVKWNMPLMSVTAETFQPDMSWLNDNT